MGYLDGHREEAELHCTHLGWHFLKNLVNHLFCFKTAWGAEKHLSELKQWPSCSASTCYPQSILGNTHTYPWWKTQHWVGVQQTFAVATHIPHDQYVSDSDYTVLSSKFMPFAERRWEWLPLNSWTFAMEINMQALVWRGTQSYPCLTFAGHASLIPRNKPDSCSFPCTNCFLHPFSIKLPRHNRTFGLSPLCKFITPDLLNLGSLPSIAPWGKWNIFSQKDTKGQWIFQDGHIVLDMVPVGVFDWIA